MTVGRGNRSNEQFTAEDKYKAFKVLLKDIAVEEERVDLIKKESAELIKEKIDYWIEEYRDLSEEKGPYSKEMKELIKIRVKEIRKNDQTVRLAFENELIMEREAKGE